MESMKTGAKGISAKNLLQIPSREVFIQAMDENLDQLLLSLVTIHGVELQEEKGLKWMISDIPLFFVNSIWRSRLDETTTESAIQAAIHRAKEHGVDITWWIGPSDTPANLAAMVEKSGFLGEPALGMACDLATIDPNPPGPQNLVIQLVGKENVNSWARVFTEGFSLPPESEPYSCEWMNPVGKNGPHLVQSYLAWLDGAPVAVSSVCYAGGVAGIYNVATLPRARRQGIGTAITHAAMLGARAVGYRFAILEAEAMAVSVYRRLGFEEFCQMKPYVWLRQSETKAT